MASFMKTDQENSYWNSPFHAPGLQKREEETKKDFNAYLSNQKKSAAATNDTQSRDQWKVDVSKQSKTTDNSAAKNTNQSKNNRYNNAGNTPRERLADEWEAEVRAIKTPPAKSAADEYDHLYDKYTQTHGTPKNQSKKTSDDWDAEMTRIHPPKVTTKSPGDAQNDDWRHEMTRIHGVAPSSGKENTRPEDDPMLSKERDMQKLLLQNIQQKLDEVNDKISEEHTRFSNLINSDEWRYAEDGLGALYELSSAESNKVYRRLKAIHDNTIAFLEQQKNQLTQDLASAKQLLHDVAVEKLAAKAYTDENYEDLAYIGSTVKGDAVVQSKEPEFVSQDGVNYRADPKYELLTDDEYDLYCYYLGTGDTYRAKLFLEQMDSTLTARLAKQNADILLNEQYDRNFTIGLAALGNGLSKGVENLSQAVRRIGGDDSVSEQSYSELMHGNMRSGLDGGLGFASDILYGVGSAAPAIVAGFVNPLAGAGVVAASTFGDCYTQARRQGKSDGEALSYGIISGLTTAATQAVLGGISKLKLTRESLGTFQKIDKVIAAVSKNPSVQRVLSTLAYMGKDAASEVFQDYLQSTLDTMVRNVTLNENNSLDLISQDKLYSSMVSAITGVALNTVSGDYYKRNMDDFQKGFWGVKEDTDSPLNRPTRDFDLIEQFDTFIDYVAREGTKPYLDDLLMDFPGYEKSTDADFYRVDMDGSHVWNWLDKDNLVPYTDSGLKKTPEDVYNAAKKTDILGTYDCALENAPKEKLSAEVTEHTVLHLPFAESTDRNGNPTHKVSKKGVRGGHDMDEFYRALEETGIPQEQLVISCTPHPKANGIYDIEYRIPIYNSKGQIVGLRKEIKTKTVYDPRLISEQQMYQWMKEALHNGKVKITDGGQYKFEGYAKNGLCFQGYIENGKFTSLYPTTEIKQTKTSKFFEKIMKKNRGQ